MANTVRVYQCNLYNGHGQCESIKLPANSKQNLEQMLNSRDIRAEVTYVGRGLVSAMVDENDEVVFTITPESGESFDITNENKNAFRYLKEQCPKKIEEAYEERDEWINEQFKE